MRKGAAWSAVAHSEGNGAPEQVLEVGAICKSCDAAEEPAALLWRFVKDGAGSVAAQAKLARAKIGAIWVNILMVIKIYVIVYV